MILLIDNYDSFTYNISQSLSSLKNNIYVDVIRNDQISVAEVKERVKEKQYEAIVISPGPGRPTDAGITMDIIRELGVTYEDGYEVCNGIPILGVCLGHQAIGEVFGGKVVLAPEPIHGKTAEIYHQGKGIFAGLPIPFQATRYHSLVVDWDTFPNDLEIIAWTEDNLIMGLQHRDYPWIQGVQFHPESILTDNNNRRQLFENFLSIFDENESPSGAWNM